MKDWVWELYKIFGECDFIKAEVKTFKNTDGTVKYKALRITVFHITPLPAGEVLFEVKSSGTKYYYNEYEVNMRQYLDFEKMLEEE